MRFSELEDGTLFVRKTGSGQAALLRKEGTQAVHYNCYDGIIRHGALQFYPHLTGETFPPSENVMPLDIVSGL